MAIMFIILLMLFFEPTLSDDRPSWSNSRIIEFIKSRVISESKKQRRIYLENLAKIQEHNEKFRKGLVSYRMHSFLAKFLAKIQEHNEKFRKGTLLFDQDGLSSDNVGSKKSINNIMNPQAEDVNSNMRAFTYFQVPENVTLPKAVDWRLRGALTKVKSQSTCASCYAFATISTIESQYYLKHKKLLQFSEQQVVDCGSPPDLNGCKGGLDSKVYGYAIDVGLTTTKMYPFEGVKGSCRLKNHSIIAKIKGFDRITPHSVADMKAAIGLQGPVAIGLNADGLKFVTGKEVLTGHWCTGELNHSVVVVGYNSTPEGQDYWIARNSWGEMCGDKGYFLLERDNADLCKFAKQVFVPYM